jgi:endogenous inhibitor of DNA gyrase (YacG/DUF329 family)
MRPDGSVRLEVVDVLPWAAEHYTCTTDELFAALDVPRQESVQ